MKKLMLLLSWLWLVSSCTPTPQAIEYGADMCDFCKMSIVDAQHGAELVTSKGKVFKFDAIECMIQYVQEKKDVAFAFELVNTYHQPQQLLDAAQCTFLISKKLPSPMGANLTAFATQAEAEEILADKGGEIYNWESLRVFFKKGKLTME